MAPASISGAAVASRMPVEVRKTTRDKTAPAKGRCRLSSPQSMQANNTPSDPGDTPQPPLGAKLSIVLAVVTTPIAHLPTDRFSEC